MQFAAKEISRCTSKPEAQDWSSAQRSARYLKDKKRVVIDHNTPEAAGESDGVVRHGLRRMQEDEAFDVGRHS